MHRIKISNRAQESILGPWIHYCPVLLHFNRPILILGPDFKFLSYTSTILPYVYNFIVKCLQSRPEISLDLMKTAVLSSFLKFYVMRSTEIDLYGIAHVKVNFIPVLKMCVLTLLGRFVWTTIFDNVTVYYFFSIWLQF